MSMNQPHVALVRARLFSDAWWARWSEVYTRVQAKGDTKRAHRLRVAAGVGQIYGMTEELAVETTERVAENLRAPLMRARDLWNYALSIISV